MNEKSPLCGQLLNDLRKFCFILLLPKNRTYAYRDSGRLRSQGVFEDAAATQGEFIYAAFSQLQGGACLMGSSLLFHPCRDALTEIFVDLTPIVEGPRENGLGNPVL